MKYAKLSLGLTTILMSTITLAGARKIIDSDVPDLSQVEVASFTMAGTGCVDGQGASVEFDGEALIIEAMDVGAIAGRGHSRADSRESCQFIVDLTVPAGWTYAVNQVSGGVAADLDDEGTAQGDFSTWFSATSEVGEASVAVTGPTATAKDFAVEMNTAVYAPCDNVRTLKFKMALRVDLGSNDEGFATAEFTGPAKLGLQWKRCLDKGFRLK